MAYTPTFLYVVEALVHDKLWELSGVRSAGGTNVWDVSYPLRGYPAYSHHDRFPPWWAFVRDDYGGNLSDDKFPP